jgi:hypothetical protein
MRSLKKKKTLMAADRRSSPTLNVKTCPYATADKVHIFGFTMFLTTLKKRISSRAYIKSNFQTKDIS